MNVSVESQPSPPGSSQNPPVPAVRVFPNPWQADLHSGKPITFDHLRPASTVKIFTVSGQWVATLPKSDDQVTWFLTNDSGDRIASGLYVYLITTDQGQKQVGKLSIVK